MSKEKEADDSGKRVAFFSVASNGSITVRRPGDYITKIIEMAGGRYALTAGFHFKSSLTRFIFYI